MEYDKERILAEELNKFLTSDLGVKDADYYSKLDFSSFIKLKSVLSNINNIITMKVTMAFIDWLAIHFEWSADERDDMLRKYNSTKPNTNGYDVELSSDAVSIIAEVKCNVPVNGGDKYGAAQKLGIEKDFSSLIKGKSKSHMNPDHCLKFMVFVDHPEIRKATNGFINVDKKFGDKICVYRDGMKFDDKEKVHVVFVEL